MSAFTQIQPIPESIIQTPSPFICYPKGPKRILHRYFLENEFLCGIILWDIIVFALTEIYLCRIGI